MACDLWYAQNTTILNPDWIWLASSQQMGRRKEWDKCICHVTLCSSDPPCPCSEHHLFVLNTISINQINLGLPERRQKSEPFRHGEVLFKAKQLYLVFSINHDSPVTKRRHKRSPESESAETGTRNCGIQRSGAALHNSGKCVVVLLLLVVAAAAVVCCCVTPLLLLLRCHPRHYTPADLQ